MRQVKDFKDVNIVLKELIDWKDKISTKDNDFHGLRIRNAGLAIDPNDYVCLSQLPTIPDQTIQGDDQHYSMVWQFDGVVTTGQAITSFTAGRNRDGTIYEAILSCEGAPSGGDLTVNFQILGVNLLSADLKVPSGGNGPVTSMSVNQPIPKIGYLTKVTPKIINGAGASLVYMALVIKRNSG